MDRRYQVFISSTFEDLIDERKAIMEGLLKIDCLPAGMELFPAADDDQWTLIKGVIDECDYYLIVSARRYGSVDAEGVSYTEREYDYAVEKGIPVIGFLPKNPGTIIGDKIETQNGAPAKLDAFQEKIKSRMVAFYDTPSDLQAAVIVGVMKLQKARPRPGWVRGNHAMTDEQRAENAELRARIAELEAAEARAVAVKATGKAEEIDKNYAHGQAKVKMLFIYRGYNGKEHIARYHAFEWSWSEVMFVIGPSMIEEASASDLIETLESSLKTDLLMEELSDVKNIRTVSVELDGDTWSTIIVQLRALKAIKAGTKKRLASDSQKYWQLTPAGDQWVTELRAERHQASDETIEAHAIAETEA
ncbi:DUF4062 domain-containing protein [Plantibacter sp. T3]|uniref:DUF4062 domain-containing protein n=1 Tax=Plantibacter sp. T3 TaxID=2653161 RepID=UPI0012F3244F|nr:DUF4062 domain-containing protein [Plantibacter sp. T3]VXC39387.1 conserved hypothetical protein [Plantibacter sp. T3]